jgi:hypothetical protein
MVYPAAWDIEPLRHEMTLSAMDKASGPLTLITEIAPVPGTVAGAHIVSSFFIYIAFFFLFVALKSSKMPDFEDIPFIFRLKSSKTSEFEDLQN